MGAAAIITTLAPTLVPAVINLVTNLIHKHEKTSTPVVVGVDHSTDPPTTTISAPATGQQKKSAAMNDFALLAGPLLVALIKSQTGKDVDPTQLETVISSLIDDVVALHNVMGTNK